jgi:hypothetical protein
MKKLIGLAATVLILSASGAVARNGYHSVRYTINSGGNGYSASEQMNYMGAIRAPASHRRFPSRTREIPDEGSYWSTRDNSCFNLPYLPEQYACSTN